MDEEKRANKVNILVEFVLIQQSIVIFASWTLKHTVQCGAYSIWFQAIHVSLFAQRAAHTHPHTNKCSCNSHTPFNSITCTHSQTCTKTRPKMNACTRLLIQTRNTQTDPAKLNPTNCLPIRSIFWQYAIANIYTHYMPCISPFIYSKLWQATTTIVCALYSASTHKTVNHKMKCNAFAFIRWTNRWKSASFQGRNGVNIRVP